jgi:hypothetical protein
MHLGGERQIGRRKQRNAGYSVPDVATDQNWTVQPGLQLAEVGTDYRDAPIPEDVIATLPIHEVMVLGSQNHERMTAMNLSRSR